MLFLLLLAGVAVPALGIGAYVKYHVQFGGSVTPELEQQYKRSKAWYKGRFRNLVPTDMNVVAKEVPGMLKDFFKDKHLREPKKPLPIVQLDADAFEKAEKPTFAWYGHSVLLMRLAGKTLLIDPMLGPNASPIGPITTKRFSEGSLEVIDQLPHIDAVLMTHDHYDHLDYDSIKKLQGKVDTFFVALGVGRHLERWGVDSKQITEFDWWEDRHFDGIDITFTPSRHFSGRGPTDRAKAFWGGWVFKTKEHSVYWSGDGGYGDHFKEIGEKLGPFDIGFMECGQYNDRWEKIHMHPPQTVQAAIDAKVATAVPVHWAGFSLAMHPWKEPVERFTAEAEAKSLLYHTPAIGEQWQLGQAPKAGKWWTAYE